MQHKNCDWFFCGTVTDSFSNLIFVTLPVPIPDEKKKLT